RAPQRRAGVPRDGRSRDPAAVRRAVRRPRPAAARAPPRAAAALPRRALRALPLPPDAEPVAQRLEPAAARALHEPESPDEARPPFAPVDLVGGLAQHPLEPRRVSQPGVGRVLREDQVARLQPLDRVLRVRGIDRERSAGPEYAACL